MRDLVFCFVALTAIFMCPDWAVPAQEKAVAKESAANQTPSDARAEFLDELGYFEQRYTDLADAILAEKYTWRPADGVRSISEVFLHVSASNFNLPGLLGRRPAAGFDARNFDKSTTEKTKVLQTLKDSFAYLRKALQSLSEVEVEKTVKLFGADRTYRYVIFFMVRHLGEHLGQSIAYARMNGVVPPWTEEQQRQSQQAEPAEKPKP